MIPLTWWYSLIEKIKSLYSNIRGNYLRATNVTAKNALAVLERCSNDCKISCPECGEYFTNELRFIDHCDLIHGYPRDMDVKRFYSSESIRIDGTNTIIKKASSDYLRYL
jgi:uncharacterized C2H2 Zn-finger protein